MLSREAYILLSLEFNLFWLRIMKEHAIFIEASLAPPQKQLALRADQFKQQFERLLSNTITLANGSVTRSALQSMQYFTRFTEEAERIAQQFTGIEINKNLTLMEYDITPYDSHIAMSARKEQDVSLLNQNILNQTAAFAQFKGELLSSQTTCHMFTFLYTSLLDHVVREAQKYMEILTALQNRDEYIAPDYKNFWLHHMSEHAAVMRGWFDPLETRNFKKADQFANTFEALLMQSERGSDEMLNNNILAETKAISEFKADITRGLIECKVQATMLPLFTDHLLREANHFIYYLIS